MRRIQLWAALAFTGILCAHTPAFAQESAQKAEASDEGGYVIVGGELAGTGALAPLERFADNGFALMPFGGYMFNKWIGAVGHFHWIGIPLKDSDDNLREDDVAWAIGASVGPRLALPLGGVEIYTTPFSVGLFTGLSPHSPISDTSWGFATGGGANLAITDTVSFGAFCKYNRLYQRAHGVGDVRFVTAGVAITVKLDTPGLAFGGGSSGPAPPK